MGLDPGAATRDYYVVRYNDERTSEGLAALGRFSEPALLILVSLAEGAKHGYAIMEDVERVAGVRMGPGTLYGALVRLEHLGLIEALESESRRRPYRLTGAGAAALGGELADLARVVAVGQRRLGLAGA